MICTVNIYILSVVDRMGRARRRKLPIPMESLLRIMMGPPGNIE